MISRMSCSGCLSIIAMTIAGTFIAGPRGLIAGFLFGVAWSLLFERTAPRETNRSRRVRELFRKFFSSGPTQNREAVNSLAGLFMAVVRQNDRGMQEVHMQMAYQVLRVYGAQAGISTRFMLEAFEKWQHRQIPVEELAEQVLRHYSRKARINFLHDMMMVAFADGRMEKNEKGILRYLASEFQLGESEYERIYERVRERLNYSRSGPGDRRNHRSRKTSGEGSLKQAYETLGLSPDSSKEKVKKQYRTLARKHHPDNYSNEEDAKQRAQEKMVEINKAYKRIMDRK